MTRVRILKRALVLFALVAVVGVVAGIGAFYLRPLKVFHGIRSMQLAGAGMKSDFVQVGAHRVHYLSGGDGPPLVLIHGVASKAEDATDLYPELLKGRRVYALDLLGYGQSDRPADADYSITMHARTVEGFLDALQIQQADVLGISMGGWIGLKIASEHPERVRKLVLVSSAGLAFKTSVTEASFAPKTLEETRAIIGMQTDRKVPDFVLRDILRESQQHAWVSQRTLKTGAQEVLDGKLARVTMPALLVWGTSDRLVPFEVGERLQRELPGSKMVKLEGCGHLAIIECRAQAMPPIVEFLR